eukprot:46981-Pyramimonas_sp.AAC.1
MAGEAPPAWAQALIAPVTGLDSALQQNLGVPSGTITTMKEDFTQMAARLHILEASMESDQHSTDALEDIAKDAEQQVRIKRLAVSYTHLTLPTILLV